MTQTHSLVALDLEYRLTIAQRIGCECAPYLVGRREVLLPAVLEQAERDGADRVDTLAAFARRLHARHEDGARRIASRYAALMAQINPEETHG